MTPSQTTPLAIAATHLTDIKDAQKHAFDTALALVDRLPFVAIEFYVTRAPASFRAHYGIQVHAHSAAVEYFERLAEEFSATITVDLNTLGSGRVEQIERLTGSLSGVPFEVRVSLGTHLVAAA